MRAMKEHSTLLVERFPTRLRLAVRAKALIEGRYVYQVFAELIEKALAAEQAKKETKP